jgi:hypothetical protein
LFQNALKLTYGNVEFKKFPGEDPRTPRSKGRERGREEWKRGGDEEGRGGEGRGGRGGRKGRVEGKGLSKGKGRKEEKREEGKGEEFGPPQCSRQIDAYDIYLRCCCNG